MLLELPEEQRSPLKVAS